MRVRAATAALHVEERLLLTAIVASVELCRGRLENGELRPSIHRLGCRYPCRAVR